MDYSCYLNYKVIQKPLNIPDLEVEIGFGRGDFLIKIAKENPEKNFLGFEIAEVSIKKLLKRVNKENIKNVKCVKIDAYWGFQVLLKDNYLNHIYINYPDPFPKKRDTNRRITRKESLYILAKKLKTGKCIEIRTDHFPFLEYTLNQAKELDCFSISYQKINISQPLTKYEEKWLNMGKDLYHILLKKEKEPEPIKIRTIKEVKHLFPVKLENVKINPFEIESKKIKISQTLNATFFKVWQKDENFLIETVLSENGFVQKFMIVIKKKDNSYIFDVSPFSDVLRTKGVQETVNFVAKQTIKL